MDKKAVPIRPSVLEYSVPKPQRELEVPMSFRVDRQTKQMITLMLRDARDQLGWVTPGDFLRWAAHNGLVKVVPDLREKKLSSMLGVVEGSLEMLREEEQQQAYSKVLNKARERVRALDDDGAQDRVPTVLRAVKAKLAEMPPGYWANKLKAKFDAEFGTRMKADHISNRPGQAEREDE